MLLGLCFFLGGRAFFLFLLACECRERNSVQSDNGLQKKRRTMSEACLTIGSYDTVDSTPMEDSPKFTPLVKRATPPQSRSQNDGRGTHTLFGSFTRTYLPSGIFKHKSATVLTIPHPFARETLSWAAKSIGRIEAVLKMTCRVLSRGFARETYLWIRVRGHAAR